MTNSDKELNPLTQLDAHLGLPDFRELLDELVDNDLWVEDFPVRLLPGDIQEGFVQDELHEKHFKIYFEIQDSLEYIFRSISDLCSSQGEPETLKVIIDSQAKSYDCREMFYGEQEQEGDGHYYDQTQREWTSSWYNFLALTGTDSASVHLTQTLRSGHMGYVDQPLRLYVASSLSVRRMNADGLCRKATNISQGSFRR